MKEDTASGLFLATVVSRILAQAAIGHYASKRMKKGKQLPASDIPDLLGAVGAPPMPAVEWKNLHNAFYSPHPGILGNLLDNLSDADKENAHRHGVVAYDPMYKNEAVLAHEAGHAQISNRPWYSPSRINQNLLRPVLGIASGYGGLLAASAMAQKYGAAAPQTLATILGISTLGNAPTLISEYQASRLGMKGLDRLYELRGLKDSTRTNRVKRNKSALLHAFGTYATGAALNAMTLAVAGGLAANIEPSYRPASGAR